MNGGCRKLATRKVPRVGLQGDLAADSYRKPRPALAFSTDQKGSMQGSSREVAGGKQGTGDCEECARKGVGRCSTGTAQPTGTSTVPFPKEPGKLAPASQEGGGPELF